MLTLRRSKYVEQAHGAVVQVLELALFLICLPFAIDATESELWGANGEKWNPNGLLPDFTAVGYRNGDEPIPDFPLWQNVTDWGAVPNDGISDVHAFRAAIANCPPNRAIGIPNGVYDIDEMIYVSADNIVLRGESRDDAIIYFPRHLREIYPGWDRVEYGLNGFIRFNGGTNRGIENVSLIFRDEQKATGYFNPGGSKQTSRHHYYEGEIPVQFEGAEQHSWLRNVYIKNANHAIRVHGKDTSNISITDVVIDGFIQRACVLDETTVGHMGIYVGEGPQRILVHNVLFTGEWNHPICVMGTKNSVFSRIAGVGLNLDHHAGGNEGNLYTEIDCGVGGRQHGGETNGFREVFWGIKSVLQNPFIDSSREHVQVGINTDESKDVGPSHHHDPIDPHALYPANMYLAQLAKLSKLSPPDQPLTVPAMQSPYRLAPVEDTFVWDSSTNSRNTTNYGTGNELPVDFRARRGYLKFDLNGLDETNFHTAKLKLYAWYLSNVEAPGVPVDLRHIADDSWSEMEMTWESGQPAAGAVIASQTVGSLGWYEYDITAHVNAALGNGDRVLSFKLDYGSSDPVGVVSFYSSNIGNGPELVLHTSADTVSAPSQPGNLSVMPGNASVSLNWDDNTEADLASYNVYRHTGDGDFVLEAMGLRSSEYLDIVVSNGTTYSYRVTAVDTAGTESAGAEGTAKPTSSANNRPIFAGNPIIEQDATADVAYSSSLANDVTDADGDSLTFTLLTGPAWLSLASNGAISGTPGSNDVGTQTWVVQVTDNKSLPVMTVVEIAVERNGSGVEVDLVSNHGSRVGNSLFPITITFNEPVINFDATDIMLDNGARVVNFAGSGRSYSCDIEPASPSFAGTITISLNSGAAKAVSDNDNSLATSISVVVGDSGPLRDVRITVSPLPAGVWSVLCNGGADSDALDADGAAFGGLDVALDYDFEFEAVPAGGG